MAVAEDAEVNKVYGAGEYAFKKVTASLWSDQVPPSRESTMRQTIHGNLLPHCNSYEGAVRVFNEAHQHKRFNEWRGLKDKRDTSKLVRMEGDNVIFRFHHTNLVTWRKYQVRVVTWDSMSSAVFSNQFLPPGMYARSGRKGMFIQQDNKHYQAGSGPLIFNLVGGKWVVSPETVLRWNKEILDKSKAARIRKILKPFMDWKATLDRLQKAPPGMRNTIRAEAMCALQVCFVEGAISEPLYPHLRSNLFAYDKDFVQQCYVLGGAVTRTTAPLGEPRIRTPYEGLSAWSFI